MAASSPLRIAISSGRQAHYNLPANAFARRGCSVTMYTSTPASRMRRFDPSIGHRFVPAPVTLANAITHIPMPVQLNEWDTAVFDRLASLRLAQCDLFLGGASGSLHSGMAAQKMGGTFVLDRACPDIRFQEAMMAEEARKAGGVFRPHSAWFRDRQVEEYERADLILSPSEYSRRTLPEAIRRKAILAPLMGRIRIAPRAARVAGTPFVVGVVGGQALRKGYLYLLQAWKKLALPNAQLKIRSSPAYRNFAELARLVDEQPSVSVIPYIPDIASFYAECDVFILPSVDDGFGMALFEAMGSGVPSITTRNTGASELLTDGRDAVIIDAFSAEQIEQALTQLYGSAEMRHELGVNGQNRVSSLLDGEIALPYEAGIDALLKARENPTAIS